MDGLDQDAVVRVAVATLWTDPSQVRTLDAPATGVPADVRNWAARMSDEERDDLNGRTLSQLLLGERVLITDIDGDWARVVATGQPAPTRDPRGYPGWVPTAQLVNAPPADLADPGTVRMVDATSTALRDEPDGDVVLSGVVLGTLLPSAGPSVPGWTSVRVPGEPHPLWARERDLTDAPTTAPDPEQVVATAARLLDTSYVWGGLSGYGIDCSGLVHLAWRRHGVTLPRDAHEQAAATEPVAFGRERPGDLYFFQRRGRPIHHVALVAQAPGPDDRRLMVHACGTSRRVLCEQMAGDRAATVVATHRVPAPATVA